MSDWPEYETRKRVRAAKIVGVELEPGGEKVSRLMINPGSGVPWEHFVPTEPTMMEHVRDGNGYALLYPDGFRSVIQSPKFEATAVRVGADDPRAAPKPDHIWCAVRTDNVHVQTDTLRATVTTSIRAFSSKAAAIDWVGVQPEGEVWVTVPTVLDPA